jgi:hypothetical protein
MPRVVTLHLPSGDAQAIELDFEPTQEPWSEYRLANGGTIRVRAVVNKLYRLLDAEGNPAYNRAGEPSVAASGSTLISASEAE